MKSPYYKQVHKDITDEQLRMMIENEKTNLLHKIITHTSYDAKIHKLLIASSKYKDITDVPSQILLDTLGYLMVAEKKSSIALLNAHNSRGIRSQSSESTENTSSLMLLPPTFFNRPPPTYLNTPPPNYFGAPPPNLMSRPPPDTPERVHLDHWNRF